jgi:hypothetical protein
MRTNRIFWALLLVCFGFLILANNLGIFQINIWGLFWPVFLILLGIWFLIGSTRPKGEIVIEEGSIDMNGAEGAKVTVKHGAGRLSVDSGAESGKLASGTFANGLDARIKRDGNQLNVTMQPKTPDFPDVFFPWNWMASRGIEWEFGFTKDIPLALVFETGAGEAHLDLTDLLVSDLVLKTGASSTDIKLPANAGHTNVKIGAGAASVKIYVPESVAARVEAEAGLAEVSVDQSRFPKVNGYFQSEGYEDSKNKVEIRIETGLASIEIH